MLSELDGDAWLLCCMSSYVVWSGLDRTESRKRCRVMYVWLSRHNISADAQASVGTSKQKCLRVNLSIWATRFSAVVAFWFPCIRWMQPLSWRISLQYDCSWVSLGTCVGLDLVDSNTLPEVPVYVPYAHASDWSFWSQRRPSRPVCVDQVMSDNLANHLNWL